MNKKTLSPPLTSRGEISLIPDFIKIGLLLVLSLILLSCAVDKRADWTILVYMAADNSLSEQAVQDIIEMEQARFPSSVNVIVQLDPSREHSDPQARRYKITHNMGNYVSSPVIEYLGEIDSGDYRNLVEFINWGINKYPAVKYALFIWSHGSGWSRSGDTGRGICPDQESFNQISIARGQLRKAFQMFSEKMDIVLIDACLMFSMEVLTEIHHRTKFVIGSENLTPYEGFPYREILDNWSGRRPTGSIAEQIATLYAESHLPGGSQNQNDFERQITVGVMNSDKLPLLLNLLYDFTDSWSQSENRQYITAAREMCFGFHFPESEIDIKEFFVHLHSFVPAHLKEELQVILNAIDFVFPKQISYNLPDNTGSASVWYPLYPQSLSGSRTLYGNLVFAVETNWLSLLDWVFEE